MRAPLPRAFPAAVLVVQHLSPPRHRSVLVALLARCTALRVTQARAGVRVRAGTVAGAPPNKHLLVTSAARLALAETERVHGTRPAADPLFASVAARFGTRALAVVLTGAGRDGAQGAQAIRQAAGFVIAQDAATAEVFGMPRAAIACGAVALVLPVTAMAAAVLALVRTGASAERSALLVGPLHERARRNRGLPSCSPASSPRRCAFPRTTRWLCGQVSP